MARRLLDVAPAAQVVLPESGLGRGWEWRAVVGLTLLLLSFGLVTLYSASSVHALGQGLPDTWYVSRQAVGSLIGLMTLALCAVTPYPWWGTLSWPLVGISIALLVVVVLPGTEAIAPEINGARRWLQVGITIQPSEIAKVAIIVWTASMAVRKSDQLQSLTRGLGPFFIVWTAVLVPVALEPHLSTACVISLLGLLIVFEAGARVAHFAFLGILALPFLVDQLRVGFRAARLGSFFGSSDPGGVGYQVQQSLVALGSGGLTGVGFGEGRQKFGFLPEAHNDFIFAMAGEEWGLLGVLFLVSMYLAVILVGYRIARRAPDLFGELLALGVTNLIAIQALVHMAVGLSLVPPTGLALPLVSYGRSNLIVTLAALGILVSVARSTPGGKAASA